MARYLTPEQLRANLSLGKTVEQWLSAEAENDYMVLKWLMIEKEPDSSYSVVYTECFDDGDEAQIDIYGFSPLDPDEDCIIDTFDTISEAVEFALNNYSASSDKFVSNGMIQEEYLDYRRSL